MERKDSKRSLSLEVIVKLGEPCGGEGACHKESPMGRGITKHKVPGVSKQKTATWERNNVARTQSRDKVETRVVGRGPSM